MRDLIASVPLERNVTIRHLLAHTSGLPDDVAQADAPYGPGLTYERIIAACLKTSPIDQPDRRVIYSNVGFGLLGRILTETTGQDYLSALRALVLKPLELTDSRFAPATDGTRVARAGDARGGNPPELETFNSDFWRGLLLPWAGLFSTPADILKLAVPFLSDPIGAGFLSPELAAAAITDQTGGLGGGMIPLLVWQRSPWGLGWELRDAKQPHWAPATASPTSFGHAGFSGSILWADPAYQVAWALSGNRTAANGWLLRNGPLFGEAVLAAVR